MRLSVAMCTYNGALYLQSQLESLATQRKLPDELVVCDDGSSDGTLSILERFAERAPFAVRIVRNDANLGYSRNFMQAVHLCTGEGIALCDQDDLWYPNKLARFAEIFESDPKVEGVFSDGDLIDGNGSPLGTTLWRRFRFHAADQLRFRTGDGVDALLRRNVVTGMAFAFRSSAKSALAALPDSWIHDGWLAFLLAMRSKLFACPERLVAYRIHSSQSIGTPSSGSAKLGALRRGGLAAYAADVHKRNLDEYQRTAVQFDDLYAFLAKSGTESMLLRKVAAKAEHARHCAHVLALERRQRLGMVLPRLRSYARFSPNGLRAMPRDLFV